MSGELCPPILFCSFKRETGDVCAFICAQKCRELIDERVPLGDSPSGGQSACAAGCEGNDE